MAILCISFFFIMHAEYICMNTHSSCPSINEKNEFLFPWPKKGGTPRKQFPRASLYHIGKISVGGRKKWSLSWVERYNLMAFENLIPIAFAQSNIAITTGS